MNVFDTVVQRALHYCTKQGLLQAPSSQLLTFTASVMTSVGVLLTER